MNSGTVIHRLALGGEMGYLKISSRSVALSVAEEVVSWDRSGRPYAGVLGGRSWRRSLAGRYLEIEGGAFGRTTAWVSWEQSTQWDRRAGRLADQVRSILLARGGGPARDAEAIVPMIAGRENDRRDFERVYEPVAILPPDQYLSVVLQLARGCPWNRCTFCEFYRDRRHRLLGGEQALEHMRGVRRFFGPGLAMRPWLFLGDANAAAAPFERVEQWLEGLRDVFPLRDAASGRTSIPVSADDPPGGFRGVGGFVDLVSGAGKSVEQWRRLKRWGLGRVYLGLETGLASLLEQWGKPGPPAAAREFVIHLKQAGLMVGVIVLTGVEGGELAAAHEEATAALIGEMPLGPEDLVYLSPYVDPPDAGGRPAGLGGSSLKESREQAGRLAARVRRRGGPRVALYDIRLFVY